MRSNFIRGFFLVAALLMGQSEQALAGRIYEPFQGGSVSSAILNTDGTAGAPALSWTSDTDTGIYRIGANQIGFSAGGTLQMSLSASQFAYDTNVFVMDATNNSVAVGSTTMTLADFFLTRGTGLTSGSKYYFYISPANDTGLTASTERYNFRMDGATATWAAGTVATQRFALFGQNTVDAATFTEAANMSIAGPVRCGATGTCPSVSGLWISSASSANNGTAPTNAYGINVQSPFGGTNNYAMRLTSNSGLTQDPTFWLHDATASAAAITRTMPKALLTSTAVASGQYMPPIAWGSTDADLTTENPKMLSYIVGKSTEAYTADTSGGMSLEFGVTANGPGTTNVPTAEMTLSTAGLNLITGDDYLINGTSVLNGTTLGSGVTASSLTSVGTLTSLQVANLNLAANALSSTSGSVDVTPLSGQNFNVTLATTGDFVVNSDQLYVDTSAAVVGIGTLSPSAGWKLNISKQSASTSGAVGLLNVAPTPDTGITAATELNMSYFEAANYTWADGTVALQRFNRFAQPTMNGTSAATFTSASNVAVSGAPICGTNATCAEVVGVDVKSLASTNGGAAPTVAIGLRVAAPTGGTTNRTVVFDNIATTGNTVSSLTGAIAMSPVTTLTLTRTTAATSGAASYFTITPTADTTQTTGTDAPLVKIGDGTTVRKWATGAIASLNQDDLQPAQWSLDSNVADSTLAFGAGLRVQIPKVQSTGTADLNATQIAGVYVKQSACDDGTSAATTCYGIYAEPPSGGAENLSAAFTSNVGVGVTSNVSARLHVVSTTEQLRVGYDASNYYSDTVASNGAVTINAVGAGQAFAFSDPVSVTGALSSTTSVTGATLVGSTSLSTPSIITASGNLGITPAGGTTAITGAATVSTTLAVTGTTALTGNVGIGVAASTQPLLISSAGNGGAGGSPSVVLQGAVNKERFEVDSFGASEAPGFQGNGGRGTVAAPLRTQTDDYLGFFMAGGYGAVDDVSAASQDGNTGGLEVRAGGIFTASSAPTYLKFMTTPTASLTRAERMRINAAGEVGILKTATAGVELDVAGDIAASGTLAITGATTLSSTLAQSRSSGATSAVDNNASFALTYTAADTQEKRAIYPSVTLTHTTGTTTTAIGVRSDILMTGNGGTVTNGIGFLSGATAGTGAVVTNRYGFYAEDFPAGGTVTNNYAYFIPSTFTRGATTTNGFWSASAAATNYFAHNLGIGSNSTPGSGTDGRGGASFATKLLELSSTGRSVISVRSDNTNNLATILFSANNTNSRDLHLNLSNTGVFSFYNTSLNASMMDFALAGGATLYYGVTMSGLSSSQAARAVCMDVNGVLSYFAGVCVVSSQRFKENIVDTQVKSEGIYALHPVDYDYKKELKIPGRQFGLIAEEVVKAIPELGIYDVKGVLTSVDYLKLGVVAAMELKKHKTTIDAQQETIDVMGEELASQAATIQLLVSEIAAIKKKVK